MLGVAGRFLSAVYTSKDKLFPACYVGSHFAKDLHLLDTMKGCRLTMKKRYFLQRFAAALAPSYFSS